MRSNKIDEKVSLQKQNPTVTVIIPTYNRKICLEHAIKSVFRQSYKNFQIIIVDDASTDGTSDWISGTYPDIRLIRLEQNRGAAAARNEGIKIAQGEYIAFLDSDDQWKPDYLSVQVKTLQESPQDVLAVSGCTTINRINNTRVDRTCLPDPDYSDLTHHFLMRNFILTMSCVVSRRSVLLEAGLMNENLRVVEDRELFIRLVEFGGIVCTQHNLVLRIIESNNLVRDIKLWGKNMELFLNIFFSGKRGKDYQHLKYEAKSLNFRGIANEAAAIGYSLYAVKMYIKAVYFSVLDRKLDYKSLKGLIICPLMRPRWYSVVKKIRGKMGFWMLNSRAKQE